MAENLDDLLKEILLTYKKWLVWSYDFPIEKYIVQFPDVDSLTVLLGGGALLIRDKLNRHRCTMRRTCPMSAHIDETGLQAFVQ